MEKQNSGDRRDGGSKAVSLEDSVEDDKVERSTSASIPDRGHGNIANMADPFEVRMRFTSQLQHLNASVTSSQKAAHYALKYRDMDEDLHSCILEQVEKVSQLVQ